MLNLLIICFILNATFCFASEESQLTIYNQNFSVVKEKLSLDLKKGENEIKVNDVTIHLEPDSVILKDINNPKSIKILEQNYESDPLSQGLLLMKNEGKEIEFEIMNPKTNEKEIKKAKIIRSGYVPHTQAYNSYGYGYTARQQSYSNSESGTPIIEMDGKLKFSLPGIPIFDSLGDDTFLKPTIMWKLWTEESGSHYAEFSYMTGGMRWDATYNAIAPENGDLLDVIGWINIDNQSGKNFENVKIKLMAGDVSKIQPGYSERKDSLDYYSESNVVGSRVAEKSFDEYHLYTLPNKLKLLDRETKQIEFIRTSNIKSKRMYVYDGFKLDDRYRGWDSQSIRSNADYGIETNTKVWTILKFKNSDTNNLGFPLPKGKVKIYRQDNDNTNEFIGENIIDHTPKDEDVEIYIGNAFDIVGERKRTDYKYDSSKNEVEEAFTIIIRNHKKEKVTINVVEHLYRWRSWNIIQTTDDYNKIDSQKIEFNIEVKPNKEKTISYRVKYKW